MAHVVLPHTGSAVLAAGAVLWRPRGEDGFEVALVHRPRYDDWSLPKGKLDEGETIPLAAAREVTEETGSVCTLGPFLTQVEYPVTKQRKIVYYYAARAVAGEFVPNEEVDELRWCTPKKARKLLSYDADRGVLETFLGLGDNVTTLLLVRHAKAGSREGWNGDDDLRPLTANGERQAKFLTRQLALFKPDRVCSAPRLRCVQTVRGVAADSDVEIEYEPALAEDRYRDAPQEGLARLRAIAAASNTPVVCSQGGVIPGLVAEVCAQDGVDFAEIPAKKGSTWVLTFRRGDVPRLVAAHYLPPPPNGD